MTNDCLALVTNPHVYHFLLDHRVGGPHVYADMLRKALDGKLVSSIVTTGRGPMTEHALLNLRHIWSPLYSLELVVNVLILAAWTMAGRIERKGAVFAVHGGANLAPIMAARLLGIPVVWHFHETTLRFRNMVNFGKWVLKGSHYAMAAVAKKSMEAYGLDDAVFLPASVDPMYWSRAAVHQNEIVACGWKEARVGELRPYRFLAVANLNPLKGMDVLLDALAEVTGPWQLKIVGAPLATHRGYGDALYQRAEEIACRNEGVQVEFVGWQDKEKIRALLASCDMFVLPSRSEACPIALLEAMAMGCRCVATDVGDVRLMMEDYPVGKIFPAESVIACREAILDMQKQRALPQAGLSACRTGASWQMPNVIARAESLYRKMLKLS